MPSKFSRIWHELKRRRVHRLMAIYAGSAYVIFEASTLIFPRWGFPDWTIDLVLYLLILGAIVTFVMGWIYDLTPDGIQKTGPVSETSTKEASPTPNGWKIASYISLVVIVGLILWNVIPRSVNKYVPEKSIAVLPFKSLSDDPEKQYQADGMMDAILLHLSKVRDIKVMARTSVEQFRYTEMTTTEICQELDVAYLLVGSFQKYEAQVRLIVQLIESGSERHIWANNYDREWKDIFTVQSEVALLVAKELQAVITPEEEKLIQKIPTSNLTAYDFYQRGRAKHELYWQTFTDIKALKEAEEFYLKAIDYDSTFAQAYSGLAMVYYNTASWEDFYSEHGLDTILVLANTALSYDDKLADAFIIRGSYYQNKGNIKQAALEFDKAIQYNSSYWMAYWLKGDLLESYDLLQALKNYHIATSLQRGVFLHYLYQILADAYVNAGFMEISKSYAAERLKLDNDSARYFLTLANLENVVSNFENAIVYGERSYKLDSTNHRVLHLLGNDYMYLGRYDKSLDYFLKYIRIMENRKVQITYNSIRIGYVYWKNGIESISNNLIEEVIKFYNNEYEMGRINPDDISVQYHLATLYAFLGDKDKSFLHLDNILKNKYLPLWMVKEINHDPILKDIRNLPDFQQIIREVEARYQAEHNRVKQWLEENEML